MVRELAEWRLTEYLDQGPDTERPDSTTLKVSHAGQNAMLFLPTGEERNDLPLRTTGAPPTSPRMSWVVLVPLLETQKGLEAVIDMPQGLTSNGSRTKPKPGMSEIKFFWM